MLIPVKRGLPLYSGFLRIVYIKDCERRSSGREVDITSGKVLYTGTGVGAEPGGGCG